MAFKELGGFCWFIGGFIFFSFLLVGGLASSGVCGVAFFNEYLVFDFVGLCLSLISLILFVSLTCWSGSVSPRCLVFLIFSVLVSIVCYLSFNMFLFWFCYEMSILPLLYLLVVESPYSERFVASWYLGGYIILTSVPMLLSILYLSTGSGGFCLLFDSSFLSCWGGFISVLVLCVSFITKIPLVPFHSWLPIVHAESSSSVSVCLSGFIMKLGVLGAFRFGYNVLPDVVFSYSYVVVIFGLSLFMFMFTCQELDGKRWLAFLSLSHIVVCVLGLNACGFNSVSTPFIYCLGHGLSAGLTFLFLWFFYNICGSRNWSILKVGAGAGVVFRWLLAIVLCSVASFPPTLSFFSEVRIFLDSGVLSLLFSSVFYFYLFLGGLIPLFIVGGCLTMHNSISCFSGSGYSGVSSLLFLSFACVFFFTCF
uniref:NADH-ubiquinone oxidoreductase chain 4 n=1 Tax=Dollfustrema vaneyi TaxID=438518 RepID=A0AAU7N5E7_9TREM